MVYPVLEKERLKRGLSVEALAGEIGICRKTYYNWQRRGGLPRKYLTALSCLFGTSADYLLCRALPSGSLEELLGKE